MSFSVNRNGYIPPTLNSKTCFEGGREAEEEEGQRRMHFRILRLLLGSIACLLCFGLLFPLAVDGGGGLTVAPPQLTPLILESSPGARRHIARIDMELLYASKRRVPNGADPIHNRRAGQSGQPPGRA